MKCLDVAIPDGVRVAGYNLERVSSAKAYEYAEDNDLDIVYPTDHELQIDLDTEAAYENFLLLYRIIYSKGLVQSIRTRPSRHGLPRRHITITMKDPVSDPILRIAFQASLGSDRVRELLCLLRVTLIGELNATLFYEKRETAE
jgi:hypothetical protein